MSRAEVLNETKRYWFFKEGNNCLLYLSETGYPYKILKIHHSESRHLREITGTLEEKAIKMQTIFNILKKYFGHQLVDSHYFVSSELGMEGLACIQTYIHGNTVDSYNYKSGIVLAAHELKSKLQNLWLEFRTDQELTVIDGQTMRNLVFPDLDFSNIIFVPPDSYYIIDW